MRATGIPGFPSYPLSVFGCPMSRAPTPTLKRRVLHAGSWTIASHGISQVIRLASNLVMTRLMAPDMFGVMAIAMTLLMGLALFSDVGLRQSIVQSVRGEDEHFLNTAWTIQIFRGALIAIFGIAISFGLLLAQQRGWIAQTNVYHETVLPYVLAVLSASMFLSGFESTKIIVATRRLELGRLAVMEIASQLIGIVAMIAWALFTRSIWALVAGGVVSAVARIVLSNVLFPGPRNRWHWDTLAYEEIIGMGKWIFFSSILFFILNNGDRLLLGGLISAKMLGVYAIAFLIVNALEQGIRKLISNVCYSAISEVVRNSGGDTTSLREIYYRFSQPIDFILFGLAGLLFTAGETVIHLLYDFRYADAGWILKILGFSLIGIRYDLAGCCYMALGRSRLNTAFITMRLLGLYIVVPIVFMFLGFRGALWALSLNFISGTPFLYYTNSKLGILDWKREISAIPALPLGLFMGWIIAISLPPIHHITF
jgi:O-antigen/teichoic acid export membrane protein